MTQELYGVTKVKGGEKFFRVNELLIMEKDDGCSARFTEAELLEILLKQSRQENEKS